MGAREKWEKFLHVAHVLHEKMWVGSEGNINRFHFFSREPDCEHAISVCQNFEKDEYEGMRAAFLDLLVEFRKMEGEEFGR